MAARCKTIRNRAYLAWLRMQPCCITGKTIGVEAAHVRRGNGGGMGIKPSDLRALPLHADEHRLQHTMGETTYWDRVGLDPDVLIIKHLSLFLNDTKAIIAGLEVAVAGCAACGRRPHHANEAC